MARVTRRAFIGGTGGVIVGASLTARSWANVPGANGDVRVAVVGLNGKGKDHVDSFRSLQGVRVVALCDVDSVALEAAAASLRANGGQAQTFVDYRELLARQDIDVVSIVTPNHQHALQAIWAMAAGKDVLVEKPVSHDLSEGHALVRAAQKYGRIVQANMQNRSSPAIAQAIAWQRAGHIGKVSIARGFCFKRRVSIGKTQGPQPIPAGVNYDLWLGPAPFAPLRRQRFHYDWHWQWATGNGDIANQGNHQLDVARRFLEHDGLKHVGLPPRVWSVGGRFGYVDDGETPNTLLVTYDYPGAPLIFELRGLPAQPGAAQASSPQASPAAANAGTPVTAAANAMAANAPGTSTPAGAAANAASAERMDEYRGLSVGNVIECEGGYIVVPAKDYSSATAFDKQGRVLQEFSGKASHYENFIQAVRSRNAKTLNAPILEGQLSSALAHLANLSQQLGQDRLAAEVKKVKDVSARPLVAEAYGRLEQHLKQNAVNLAATRLRAGASLTIDPATQALTGEHAAAATRLSTREYRAPFVLPKLG